jgi:hypothetical protein
MTTAILRITVDGAAYDEPDTYVVPDSRAVRAALRSWQSACEFYGDGAVEVADGQPGDGPVLSSDEFLEVTANALAADADEILALPRLWRAGREWRRE